MAITTEELINKTDLTKEQIIEVLTLQIAQAYIKLRDSDDIEDAFGDSSVLHFSFLRYKIDILSAKNLFPAIDQALALDTIRSASDTIYHPDNLFDLIESLQKFSFGITQFLGNYSESQLQDLLNKANND